MSAKGPERIAAMVEMLRQWQSLERQGLESTSTIMEETDNKLIWQMMEIIRNDSVQHHRVQQFIIDSLTKKQVRLTPEETRRVKCWTDLNCPLWPDYTYRPERPRS